MKHTLRLAAASTCLAALAAGANEAPILSGYTCCNLHHSGDWISDGNWASFPMIPAGTPIKVLSYGSNRAHVEIDGKSFRIGHDYGRNEEPLERFVAKLVVPENPRERIERYPDAIREAVRTGKLTQGMTREQAIIARGYPATHRTPVLDAGEWTYWSERLKSFRVTWDGEGRIRDIR